MNPKDLQFASGANSADHWRTEAARQMERNNRLYDALATAHRDLSIYRWVALVGWLVAIALLTLQPAYASADMTLPKGMLACDSRDAWADQSQNLGAGLTILSPGCVFTNRDLRVEVIDFKVFSGTEVYVRDVDLTIFVDGGVLR